MNRCAKLLFLSLFAALIPVHSFADGTDNDVSPYSKFGFGIPARKGSAFNQAMGGVGIATRDNRHINTLNPAAVTARDTLAFMADFGVSQKNTYAKQTGVKSAYNTFNINNAAMSFPIWKSSAFMVGIAPFSSVGYDITRKVENPDVIGNTGNITDTYSGNGSLYNIYVGAGVTFWKRLSLGAQFDYYFGNITKTYYRTFSSSSYRTMYSGSDMYINNYGGKVGIQYEEKIAKTNTVTLGATYRFKSRMRGENEFLNYAVQSEVIDTLMFITSDKSSKNYSESVDFSAVNLPWEASVGLSYKYKDIFRIEADYTISDWRNSGVSKVLGLRSGGFESACLHSGALGFEYTPNRSDIRYYFKRVTYRGGIYYNQENYTMMGSPVASAGITIGASLPVFRWLNNITLAIEAGRRGNMFSNTDAGIIRENYVNFSVSMNIFDIWFVKPRYE